VRHVGLAYRVNALRSGDGSRGSLCVQIVERFIDAGASICVLRLGAEGSLLAAQTPADGGNVSGSRADVHMVAVPAAPASVRDVTGCGNAFNGGLLAALQRGETLCDAAAWGSAVAASMAEATGVPACGPGSCELRLACQNALLALFGVAPALPLLLCVETVLLWSVHDHVQEPACLQRRRAARASGCVAPSCAGAVALRTRKMPDSVCVGSPQVRPGGQGRAAQPSAQPHMKLTVGRACQCALACWQ
jgi:pfkB family carbohydrate kinase